MLFYVYRGIISYSDIYFYMYYPFDVYFILIYFDFNFNVHLLFN